MRAHLYCLAFKLVPGFSVAYYQVPWSSKVGALQTLGLETGYVRFYRCRR